MLITLDPTVIDDAFRALVAQLTAARASAPPPEIDTQRLTSALTYVTEHPEEHDQALWAQRHPTDGRIVGCLAYHAARLAGYVVDPRSVREDGRSAYVMTASGTTRHLHDAARQALGLTSPQAVRLFSPFNTVDKLWALAAEFTGGRVTRP